MSARTRRGRVADVVLTILSIGGAVCIALVVIALTAKLTLVMFASGSMSPTIPQGSVALVQRIPASEIAVGDIITVERVAALPITHRVVEVVSVSPEATTFRMRGDANADVDVVPYTATEVQRVITWVPGIAPVVVALQQPLLLAPLSLGAAALVTWSFWPRRARVEEPDPVESVPV